jgi:hypothetical protein
MIWLSVLLVFGTAGLILFQMATQSPVLVPGYEQLVHARIPWLLLTPLWLGGALGVAALWRGRTLLRGAVLALELPLVALASWYFLSYSFLPPHELARDVGDAFPEYALLDQDGARVTSQESRAAGPALYIFYRGDW